MNNNNNVPQGPMNNKNKNNRQSLLAFLISLMVVMVMVSAFSNMMSDHSSEISYDEFLEMVKNDEVKSVTIESDQLAIEPKDQPASYGKTIYYTSAIQSGDALVELLEPKGIKLKKETPDPLMEVLASLLSIILPTLLLFGLLMIFMKRMNKSGGMMGGVGKSKAKAYVEKETGVTFQDRKSVA